MDAENRNVHNEEGVEHVHSGSGTGAEYQYAGFWLRFLAAAIDGIVLWAASALTFDLIRKAQGIGRWDFSWVDIVEFIAEAAYFVILTVVYGQTLGKMVVGIRVIPQEGGANRWGAIILREVIGKFVSAIILLIGYLMAAFDSKKRAMHDRIAGTYVIKVR
jgi:uncharacterized RDD family membrane protein YckC